MAELKSYTYTSTLRHTLLHSQPITLSLLPTSPPSVHHHLPSPLSAHTGHLQNPFRPIPHPQHLVSTTTPPPNLLVIRSIRYDSYPASISIPPPPPPPYLLPCRLEQAFHGLHTIHHALVDVHQRGRIKVGSRNCRPRRAVQVTHDRAAQHPRSGPNSSEQPVVGFKLCCFTPGRKEFPHYAVLTYLALLDTWGVGRCSDAGKNTV